MIDLHMHSVYSDGSERPEELLAQAEKLNLRAIALTDHDTMDGVEPLLAAARKTNSPVKTLGGVELSLDYKGRSLHMLGYLCDPSHAKLNETLEQIIEERDSRNDKIVAKLNELGVPITMDDVRKHAGEKVVARPHIAAAMVEAGAVDSNQQAFDEYLASGAKAHVDRFRLSPQDGVRLILDAGGAPVLAHPCLAPVQSDDELREMLRDLVDAGLRGLEVFYSLHSDLEIKKYKALAREYGLLMTGGSDYHGKKVKKDIELGYGKNRNLRVADELLQPLVEAATTDLKLCTNFG